MLGRGERNRLSKDIFAGGSNTNVKAPSEKTKAKNMRTVINDSEEALLNIGSEPKIDEGIV
jgi:hypothetical protein